MAADPGKTAQVLSARSANDAALRRTLPPFINQLRSHKLHSENFKLLLAAQNKPNPASRGDQAIQSKAPRISLVERQTEQGEVARALAAMASRISASKI